MHQLSWSAQIDHLERHQELAFCAARKLKTALTPDASVDMLCAENWSMSPVRRRRVKPNCPAFNINSSIRPKTWRVHERQGRGSLDEANTSSEGCVQKHLAIIA